ncbi:hypothetical protein NDU88_007547 [Pleurodeles waltl]|uniref:Uncharacterized protein n=1 Tax=Pleurodeles waltl TaxID=8319 RepID=A0AAV7QPD3_PLEWA|nr:hypothetical protein NDU88_007547 [Pleurodeles waltl]
MSCKTAFKPCDSYHRTMSVMDLHLVCLWCLERDHDPKSCSECLAMNPKKKKSKKDKRSSTSPRRSDDEAPEERQHSRPPCLEPSSGSAPRFPDFPGATPDQLKEFYKAMRLIFGQTDPPLALSDTGESVGVPLGIEVVGFGHSSGGLIQIQSQIRPDASRTTATFPASGQTSMLPTSVGPTISIDPILIPDDPEPEQRHSMLILSLWAGLGPGLIQTLMLMGMDTGRVWRGRWTL